MNDFGHARNSMKGIAGKDGKIELGTLGYYAPEQFVSAATGAEYDLHKADIWAAGLILLEIMIHCGSTLLRNKRSQKENENY